MTSQHSIFLYALSSAFVLAGADVSTAAGDVAGFYKGRNVDVIVGYNPGGGYDAYTRLLGRHIGNHIPGKPTIVAKNMPGAGSLKSANYLYNVAPKDGTVFGMFAGGIAMDALIGGKKTDFDPRKFNWLGSITESSSACWAWRASGFKSLKDVMKKEFVVGATSGGSSTFAWPTTMNAFLGTKFKVIPGYGGTKGITLAVERGEVQGLCGYFISSIRNAKPDWLRDKKIVMVVQEANQRHADYPDVPTVFEYAKDEKTKQAFKLVFGWQVMGRPFTLPPGVPSDRVTALRAAFEATMKDDKFLADAKRSRLLIAPRTHQAGAGISQRRVEDAEGRRAFGFCRPRPRQGEAEKEEEIAARRRERKRAARCRPFSCRNGIFPPRREAAEQAALRRVEIGAGMDGRAVVPDQQVAGPPLVGIDEFGAFDQVEKALQQRIRIFFGQSLDGEGHQAAEEQRLAPGLGYDADGRVAVALVPGIVAPQRGAVQEALERVASREQPPGILIECVVGRGGRGEHGVAARLGDLDGVEQRRPRRRLDIGHVGMEMHLAVRQGADGLAVLPDVGHQHGVAVVGIGRIALRFVAQFLRAGPLDQLAEQAGDGDLPVFVQVLVAHHDDAAIEPGADERVCVGGGQRAGEVDARNLGADVAGEGGGGERHGSS
jgi:tripartite-type tricarboxylate transporter receptor subunit TctC